MVSPTSSRPPTISEAFFRTGFGCASAFVMKLAVIGLVIFVVDCQQRKMTERREAERAAASAVAARLADEFAKETDADGRFVCQSGPLPELDVWGNSFRLAYEPGHLTDGLEVRSAGPDGEWDTRDDVVAARESKISAKAVARDAASGLLDAVKKRLVGKKSDEGANSAKNEKK